MKHIEDKLNNLRTVGMTDYEKSVIRAQLIARMEYAKQPARFSVPSPYLFFMRKQVLVRALIIFLVVAVAGGTTLTYASASALPGDILYPVKIHVTEALEDTLAPTPEKKIFVQKKHIENRIAEIKTLQSHGPINKAQAQQIKEAFVDHTKELNDTINTLQSQGKEEVVIAVTQELIPTLTEFKNDQDSLANTQETDGSLPIDTPLTDSIPNNMGDTVTVVEPTTNSTTTTIPTDATTKNPVTVSLPKIDATTTDENITPDPTVETTTNQNAVIDLTQTIASAATTIQAQQEKALASVQVKDLAIATDNSKNGDQTTQTMPTESQTTVLPTDSTSTSSNTSLKGKLTTTAATAVPKPKAFVHIKSTINVPASGAFGETTKGGSATISGSVSTTLSVCPTNDCRVFPRTYAVQTLVVYPIGKPDQIVAQIDVAQNGTFSMNIPAPGTYVLDLKNTGKDTDIDFPKTVTVENGTTVTIAIAINTEIK